MYFGMKSNGITKDRLEYYASGRSMATELIVTDGMEVGASCPTFPRSGGLASNWALGLYRQSLWSKLFVPIVSGSTKKNEERSIGSAPLDHFLFGIL